MPFFCLELGTTGRNNENQESQSEICNVEEEVVHNSTNTMSSLDALEQEICELDTMKYISDDDDE